MAKGANRVSNIHHGKHLHNYSRLNRVCQGKKWWTHKHKHAHTERHTHTHTSPSLLSAFSPTKWPLPPPTPYCEVKSLFSVTSQISSYWSRPPKVNYGAFTVNSPTVCLVEELGSLLWLGDGAREAAILYGSGSQSIRQNPRVRPWLYSLADAHIDSCRHRRHVIVGLVILFSPLWVRSCPASDLVALWQRVHPLMTKCMASGNLHTHGHDSPTQV